MIKETMKRTTNISFHKIKIDLEKSQDSYIFDSNSDRTLLDFFGMYSSLALGYNHPITKSKEYQKDILRAAGTKITNCEMLTQEYENFVNEFSDFAIPDDFSCVHFSCTGGLAVEGAIKTALYHSFLSRKLPSDACIVSFRGGFHGITSYGNFTTDRDGPAKPRLSGFPDMGWPKISTCEELQELISSGKKVDAVIIEPIQCTVGDNHFSDKFLSKLRKITRENQIPLIFDEVQTGFCSSGRVWYFQKFDWSPDIVVFGKKSQASGFFVKKGFDSIFEKGEAGRLCITFDGDIIDLVRCTHIIRHIRKNNILENVRERAKQLRAGLETLPVINLRNCGLLFCFDFSTKNARDIFVTDLRKNNMICNPTGAKSVRLRPSLSVAKEEVSKAVDTIRKTLREME